MSHEELTQILGVSPVPPPFHTPMSVRSFAPCHGRRWLRTLCAFLLQSNWLTVALNSLYNDRAAVATQPTQFLQEMSLEAGETFPADSSRTIGSILGAVAHSAARAGQLLGVQLDFVGRGAMSDEAVTNERLTRLSQFKVFIYDLPPAFNMDLVECYFSKHGVSVWNDEEKERAQNTADIWMHKLLLRYPYRTYNISEASMIYIPFYGFLSTHFSGIHDEPGCNGIGHWERAHDLAAFLQRSDFFIRYPARHAMTVSFWAVAYSGYPYWEDEPFAVLTGPAYNMMQKVNLLVYEEQFGSFRNTKEYQTWGSPLVTIPYVPSRQLAEAMVRSADTRPIFVYFRGNLKLDSAVKTGMSKGERLRQRLNEVFGSLPGALLVDSTMNFSHIGYIDEMKKSIFCIVPRGDTPTSRRLFDAISAGCIPVILADDIKLPFSTFIDWSAFTVKIPEADVNSHGAKVTKDMLAIPEATIRDMQKKLLQARDDFVYGRGTPKFARPGRAPWNALLSLRNKMLSDGNLE